MSSSMKDFLDKFFDFTSDLVRFYKNNISFERRSIIQKHKNG